MTREKKPSAVSLQRGMGEERRTDREGGRERQSWGAEGDGCPPLTLSLTAESPIGP